MLNRCLDVLEVEVKFSNFEWTKPQSEENNRLGGLEMIVKLEMLIKNKRLGVNAL